MNTERPAPRDIWTTREFERYLTGAGATRSQAMKAVHALPPHAMRALLPMWRRVRVAWKARHV